MSKLLDTAIAKARSLPPEDQDALGAVLLDEIEAERAWDERFAGSQDVLKSLAEAAREEAAAEGRVERDPADL